ncbi:DUF1761 domain-containing protein [Leucobacter sp. UT-8R-CII-1-4]|uniref:DUF1761 domain-containing protein n=1 Tax=Leucobacter sp. UT-8R-CII-1-4 TaxID=3040075 RepID=UPI0024A9CD24|nr:DUF1761 domain-containing protein [Leucobacter sp. UT-8R-CII-1-4]MDI6022312.1 DUF1761 domain-containing protein [Leucobacter sp. UT-8R-CII-1-4]
MVPEINYLAVIAATLSTMVVGFIWYSPKVMGNTWMRLTGVKPGEGKSPLGPILATLVVSFVTSWVLAGAAYIAWQFYGGLFVYSALITGLLMWAGFTAARFVTHDAFEGRPARLTVLNCAHELVTIIVLSLVIGVWPPALA